MDSQIAMFGAHAVEITCPAGADLCRAGEANQHFYLLKQGTLSASLTFEHSLLRIASIRAGDWIGELPQPGTGQHKLTVTATQPCTLNRYAWQDVRHQERASVLLLDLFAPVIKQQHFCTGLISALQHLDVTLSTAFVQKLLRYCSEVELNSGQALFYQGDSADAAYLLLSGRLEVRVGSNATQVGEITRGDLFGEMGLLTNEPRSATLIAARHCHLAKLPGPYFNRIFKAFPDLSHFLMNTLIRRLQAQNERLSRNDAAKNRVLLSCDSVAENALQPVLRHCQNADVGLFSVEDANQALNGSSVFSADKDLLAEWLEQQELNHDLNLFACNLHTSDWTHVCLHRADEIWVLVDANQTPAILKQRLGSLLTSSSWKHADITLVLCHYRSISAGTRDWKTAVTARQHYHFLPQDMASVRRLIRHVTDQTVGLVLGGGGAKGFAHIGVMQALEEANIEVDAIGGTSIGAVMGGWLARGWNSHQAKQAIDEYFVNANPLGDYTLPLISLSRSERIDALLQLSFEDLHIEDLPISFYCMSSDLSVAREVCHQRGLVWRAIRASLSIPGVITPIIDNGHFLVDGALLNNLPVDVMQQHINGTVIAIDVSDKACFLTELKTLPSPWAMAWRKWISRERMTVPSILETLLRSSMLASDSRRNKASHQADYYIRPNVEEYGLLAFGRANEIIAHGYREGQIVAEEIGQLVPRGSSHARARSSLAD